MTLVSVVVWRLAEFAILPFLRIALIGLVVGIVAKLLIPGKDPGGIVITTLIGIAGAVLAGYIGQAIGWYEADEPSGFLGSVFGAMFLLLLYRLLFRRRSY